MKYCLMIFIYFVTTSSHASEYEKLFENLEKNPSKAEFKKLEKILTVKVNKMNRKDLEKKMDKENDLTRDIIAVYYPELLMDRIPDGNFYLACYEHLYPLRKDFSKKKHLSNYKSCLRETFRKEMPKNYPRLLKVLEKLTEVK